jgi:glycosyltransferase involved in cell wall biosynthesis
MDFYWKKQTKIVEDLENRSEILIGELNQAGVVISPSKFLRDVYIGEGVDPQKIIFSRQGVDLSIFPTTIPPKPKSEILRVGYIGQIVNIKGVHLVIEAIKKRPQLPIRLDIYGDLTDFPKYVEKIRASAQNDARIHIRGKIEHKNLFQVMENIDVLVVPSIWYENSPNIIQETFATHTPVITSNLGGMAELIEHQKNGLLFDPGDSDSLAEQIQLFIDSPGLGEKLAQGIQPVKSVEAEMDELETLYKQVIR